MLQGPTLTLGPFANCETKKTKLIATWSGDKGSDFNLHRCNALNFTLQIHWTFRAARAGRSRRASWTRRHSLTKSSCRCHTNSHCDWHCYSSHGKFQSWRKPDNKRELEKRLAQIAQKSGGIFFSFFPGVSLNCIVAPKRYWVCVLHQ